MQPKYLSGGREEGVRGRTGGRKGAAQHTVREAYAASSGGGEVGGSEVGNGKAGG